MLSFRHKHQTHIGVIIRKSKKRVKEKQKTKLHLLQRICDLHDHGWFPPNNQISLKQNLLHEQILPSQFRNKMEWVENWRIPLQTTTNHELDLHNFNSMKYKTSHFWLAKSTSTIEPSKSNEHMLCCRNMTNRLI